MKNIVHITKYLPLAITLAMVPSILTGCSDDDKDSVSPLKNTTFTDSSGLTLTLNGQPVAGKTAEFTVDGNKGHLKLSAQFDLSETGTGMTGSVAAPGVLPGSPETVLDLNLSPKGKEWEFKGSGSTDYCDYSYSGEVSDRNLTLSFSDVELKSGGINPQIWQPAPLTYDSEGNMTSNPFYLSWEFDPIPDIDIDFNGALNLLTVLPVIPVYNGTAYMSVAEALTEVVKTMAFLKDGNMLVTYISTLGGAAHLAQTYPNRFEYVVTSQEDVRLYLDPMSLFGFLLVNTSGGTPADEIDLTDKGLFPSGQVTAKPGDSELKEIAEKLMKSSLSFFLPRMAQGLPMKYSVDDKGLHIFVDTEMATDLFQNIVIPVITEESSFKEIIAYLSKNPLLSPMIPELERVLPLIPQIFERTNSIRLGVTLTPYKQ